MAAEKFRADYMRLAEEWAEKAARFGMRRDLTYGGYSSNAMSREEDQTAAILAQTYASLAVAADK